MILLKPLAPDCRSLHQNLTPRIHYTVKSEHTDMIEKRRQTDDVLSSVHARKYNIIEPPASSVVKIMLAT